MITKVFYHSGCSDGFGAAYAAWKFYGKDASYHPLVFGQGKFALETQGADRIYFLDVSPKVDQLREILDNGTEVIIIDHHKTNVEEVKNFTHPRLTKHFNLNHSAAVLTWEHFHPPNSVPELLKYVEDYDLWLKELPLSDNVSAGLRIEPLLFVVWEKFVNKGIAGIRELQRTGGTVLRTERHHYRRSMKEVQWKTFGGVKIPVINVTVGWNEATNELLQKLNVPVAGYYFDRGDGIRQYGLRGKGTIDVSEIAKSMGGGGHAKAAGFQLNQLDDNYGAGF